MIGFGEQCVGCNTALSGQRHYGTRPGSGYLMVHLLVVPRLAGSVYPEAASPLFRHTAHNAL